MMQPNRLASFSTSTWQDNLYDEVDFFKLGSRLGQMARYGEDVNEFNHSGAIVGKEGSGGKTTPESTKQGSFLQ